MEQEAQFEKMGFVKEALEVEEQLLAESLMTGLPAGSVSLVEQRL